MRPDEVLDDAVDSAVTADESLLVGAAETDKFALNRLAQPLEYLFVAPARFTQVRLRSWSSS